MLAIFQHEFTDERGWGSEPCPFDVVAPVPAVRTKGPNGLYRVGLGSTPVAEAGSSGVAYATAVMGLCKDVEELKELVDDQLSDIFAELIVEEWMVCANWHEWCTEAVRDLERQVEADPGLREKLEELRAEPR